MNPTSILEFAAGFVVGALLFQVFERHNRSSDAKTRADAELQAQDIFDQRADRKDEEDHEREQAYSMYMHLKDKLEMRIYMTPYERAAALGYLDGANDKAFVLPACVTTEALGEAYRTNYELGEHHRNKYWSEK